MGCESCDDSDVGDVGGAVACGYACGSSVQELNDTLQKARPNLFRLASETDDKETEAIGSTNTVLSSYSRSNFNLRI